jgi:hypothetical protein
VIHDALDIAFGAAAIGDQVGDGADLQAVQLGEGDQIGHPRHRAVVVHDLADHAGGGQAGHAADVDRRLGMARADQHAAVARDQREDVAGRDDVVGALVRIDGDLNRAGAVGGADAGGDALARLDRDGEGGAHALAVVARHRRQAQLAGALGGHGQADQAARVAGHEVDLVRRRELGRDDDIALVLAILGVDEDVGRPLRASSRMSSIGLIGLSFMSEANGASRGLLPAREVSRQHVDLEIHRIAHR